MHLCSGWLESVSAPCGELTPSGGARRALSAHTRTLGRATYLTCKLTLTEYANCFFGFFFNPHGDYLRANKNNAITHIYILQKGIFGIEVLEFTLTKQHKCKTHDKQFLSEGGRM